MTISQDASPRLGIIGTAGRQSDGALLNRESYAHMVAIAEQVARTHGVRALVSGGAAWADHVAVGLVALGTFEPRALTLHLPAGLRPDGTFEETRNGGASNHYHRLFRRSAAVRSAEELAAVAAKGATITVSDGFFARNARVADDADILLAFTFGEGPAWEGIHHAAHIDARAAGLKDGGTAHTWTRCRAGLKIHVRLA